MSRPPRNWQANYCYRITPRCNNREFRLTRFGCPHLLLFAIERCRQKYGFRLYGLWVMSNHVQYLIEPEQPEDLPKIMHCLNWYNLP